MNNSFVKAAGVCSIVAVVIIVVSVILFSASGVESDPEKIEAYLRDVHNNNALYASAWWVYILGTLFLIPTFLGFYQAFREGGHLLWVALVTSLIGVIFILAVAPISLGIVSQLAAGYAEAGFNIRPALEVVARTLLTTNNWLFVLGSFLSLGIGVVLFSVGVLRTNVIGHWLGWIGVVVGVLEGVLILLTRISNVFEMIAAIPFLLVLLWLIIMGVFLLRLRESA